MKKINSFVRRNSRLTDSHKRHLKDHGGLFYESLPLEQLQAKGFVGLEIGFGTGDSLLDVARNHPEQCWVGVEVYELGVAGVIRQAKLEGIDNLVLLIGDVCVLTEDVDSLFHHIRIFFPDPWPKKRHHKRRLMNQTMLNHIHQMLTPQGILHFATDCGEYADATRALCENHAGFEVSHHVCVRPETKFSRKATEPTQDLVYICIK